MERRSYQVDAIHCGGCERAVREGLSALEGVEEVAPDARAKTVTVVFAPERVGEGQVRARLADLGFPVVERRDADGAPRAPADVARFLLLVLAVAAVALAGYVGYVVYPRFDLPAVEGVAVLGLAAAAGVASFFSPCSFPLLLGLLGRQAGRRARGGPGAQAHGGPDAQPRGGPDARPRPAVFGGALALGAGAFLLLAGVLIAAGGGVVFEQVTFASPAGIAIRGVVGVLLVILGLVQVGVVPSPFHRVEQAARPVLRRQARLRRRHPVLGYGLFGFGYVLAGFG